MRAAVYVAVSVSVIPAVRIAWRGVVVVLPRVIGLVSTSVADFFLIFFGLSTDSHKASLSVVSVM